MTEKSLWLQKSVHSEFFWIKVKRFSEFHFTAKFWCFKLKMRFRMVGEFKKASRHFFCQKNGGTKTQVFTSLCRQAQLHSKGAAFSSLPRRNEMKPGHLHQTPEALLVKSFHSADASFHLWSRSFHSLVKFSPFGSKDSVVLKALRLYGGVAALKKV